VSEHPRDADRWARIQAVFLDVLDRPEHERRAFLGEVCADDRELLTEVESLVRSHERDGPIAILDDLGMPGALPAGIGPYRILHPLGQGGMGSVYLAEREGTGFTQRVALKLIRAGFADPHLAERLETERRILARLEHPGIARLIDGGTTSDGQPYYAMEYVEGATLLDYCESRRLDTAARIRLFTEVCDAVHYAHQQLVVHRDLKPGNILVTADGRPKLLDFGIAKPLDPSEAGDGATRTAAWITPAYASPEQVRGRAVSILTDVYALGILLYELLAGYRPYDVDSLSPAEVERVVCDVPADPPSARAPTHLRSALRGDLDRIVLKALSKEPERRYASARELTNDLQRYLDGHPVRARPDSFAYRASKFVRRHRVGVATAAIIAVTTLAGLVGTAWQARRAMRQAAIASAQRDRAESEAEKAALVTDLMVDLFRLSDPAETLGDTVTARQLLDEGTRRIERELADRPDLQAAMLAEVASVYANIGLLDRAERLARRALTLNQEVTGPASIETSRSLDQVGRLAAARGRREEAVSYFRRSIEVRSGLLAAPDTVLARTQSDLAWLLRDLGRHDDAAALFRRALETQTALLGEDDPAVASTRFGLAAAYHDQDSLEAAVELFRATLARFDTSRGRPHPAAATALLNIGMLRLLREDYEEAAPLLRSAVTMRTALYGPEHPAVLEAFIQFGNATGRLGRFAEAERMLRDVLDRANRTLGHDHHTTVSLRLVRAGVLTALGRYAEANAAYDTALAVKRSHADGNTADLLFTTLQSAEPLIESGRTRAAEERYGEALALTERGGGGRGVGSLLVLRGLARVAWRRGSIERAAQMLDEALEIATEQLREDHRYTLDVQRDRAAVLLERGAPREAATLLEAVLEGERHSRASPHPRIGRTLTLLGEADLAVGDAARAEQRLRDAMGQLEALPATHWWYGEARSLLGASLRAQGRPDEARALLEEGAATIRAHLGPTARETRRADARLTTSP